MTSGAATSSNMASSTHDELCRQIYEQIYRKLERADEDILRFATRGTARKVLQRDNFLPLFLSSLVLPESTAMDQFGLTEELFCDRIDNRKLHDFLAILIFASCGIEAARAFTTKLVATKAWPVIDRKRNHISSLPASRIDLIELFSDVVAADKFFMTQALFCTVQIRKREEVRIQNPDGQRLPYLAEQPLAKGSFGKVFKVKIAKGHFYDPKTGLANPDPIEIARKDYLISKEFRVQGEREIMEKILTSTARTCENILENYGSLEIGPGTYCLFMPLAICDLSVYMLQHHTMRPSTTAEKAKIILSAQGLAGGLNFLHREMKTSEMEDLVCYHMDLKPNNILLFRETINDEDRIIWKISDFGMARVKIRRRGQDGDREKDFNSWFLKRQKPPDPSPSHTWNQRGEGTYLAPESIASTRSMKAESDVWSLACVISVVFAYLDDGGKGVSDYLEERINYASSAGLDRFFLRGTRFTPTKVHPVVKKWHERLIDRASGRDINEGSTVKFMLDYLEDRVFQIEPTKRHSAKEVQERLQRTFKMYQDMGRTDENPPRRGPQPPKRFMRRVRQARVQPDDDEQVEEWRLRDDEPFTGCVMSPDAALVAYWTDTKIFLYTSQSLSSGGDHSVSPAAEPYLLPTANCIWKSICLTQKYLIASTTGANFHCYIFELERGTPVDANFDRRYRITLPYPEIKRLAISPNSQTLACILRDKEEEENSGSLFLAPIAQLMSGAERLPSSSREGASSSEGPTPRDELLPRAGLSPSDTISPRDRSSSNGSMHNQFTTSTSDHWRISRLDWPGATITHLSFSTNEDIYYVVRPELTVRSREHTIPIIHLDLRSRRLYPLNIESRGLDNSSTAGLFTTFASFRQDPATCVVITRQKHLYIQKLAEDDQTPAIHKELRNYRVLKLMMGWNDRKMFALGTTSANQRMLLLEMTVPRGEAEEVCVRELAHLQNLSYHEEFTETLSDEQGEKYVLIASLAGANRHAIYRIRLPG